MPSKADFHAMYADVLDQHATVELHQLVKDLDTLYSAAEPPTYIATSIERAIQARMSERQQLTIQRRFRFPLLPNFVLRGVSPIAALLIFVMLTAAAYAVVPLLSRMFTEAQRLDQGVHYVEQAHLWETVNQSQSSDGFTITVQRVYADANRVIVGYTLQLPEGYQAGNPLFGDMRLTTGAGTLLPWQPYGMSAVFESRSLGSVWSFDAGSIQGNPDKLTLQLMLSDLRVTHKDDSRTITSQTRAGDKNGLGPFVFDFTVPFHQARIAEINQTVTVKSVPITLERVVVTPSETRVYLRFHTSNGVPAEAWRAEATPNLVVDGWEMSNETNYTFPFWPTLGGETYPLPFALFDKHGQWMLTIPYVMAHAEPTRSQQAEMVTGPWEFKFVVP